MTRVDSPQRIAEHGAVGRTRALLIVVRYVLPAAVLLAGLTAMAMGTEADLEGGAGLVSAGLAIYAMNWLYRTSIEGDQARDEEDAARTYFDIHGHWPDEGPRGPGA